MMNKKNELFKKNLEITKDTKKERLLIIRQQLEKGDINEDEISEEDLDDIIAIYDQEIAIIEQQAETTKHNIKKMLEKKFRK